jgi:hypothetical protein
MPQAMCMSVTKAAYSAGSGERRCRQVTHPHEYRRRERILVAGQRPAQSPVLNASGG